MDDMATSLLTKFTSQSNIFIKNPSTTHAKLSKILTGGANNLSLTVDFDRTLTSAASLSSHGILEAIEGLADKQYQAAAHETTAKYYPIEIDPVMTVAEKIPHMKKWYETNHALMAKQGITRADVSKAARHDDIKFRNGSLELLETAGKRGIPLCVFSAGLGDVIEEVLKHNLSNESESLRVVSNKMVWSATDLLVGFDNDNLIHMFNKNQSALSQEDVAHFRRDNRILLGDSIGDVTMLDGDDVLRVGFLNDHVEEKMERYSEAFDVVITEDGSMEKVLELINALE